MRHPRRRSCVYLQSLLSALLFVMVLCSVSCGGGSGGSVAPPPNQFTLSVSPGAATIYPSSSFTVLVTASTNSSAQPSLTSVTLPAGVTTKASFPLGIPSGGVSIDFQTSSGIAAGNYTLEFSGSLGSMTSTANLVATVQTNPPSFFFPRPLFSEIVVPVGGSSQVQVSTIVDGQAAYDVQLSLSGLPAGTSATISPSTISVGQSATVTIAATNAAALAQNVAIMLTGTPSAPVPSANLGFLLDVAPKPGSLPNNRTDYVSTEHTPYAAVYDPTHQLIFASNDSWNRVEAISSTTHALVKRISIPEPRGIDITQDHSMIWVTTGSRQMFAINTTTFEVSRYLLPLSGDVSYWEGSQVFALADGSLMIVSTAGLFTGSFGLVIWNPATNTITYPTIPFPLDNTVYNRSGDGKRAYLFNNHIGGAVMYYDVASQTFSSMTTLNAAAFNSAVNKDGSRFILCNDIGGFVYDGSYNQLGVIPPCGPGVAPFFEGGAVFSSDGNFIYEELLANTPLILKIDTNTLNLVSAAPAMPMIPVMTELDPPYYVPNPFAVDDTGMVFGIEYWGIAFDDSSYAQNYSAAQPGTPTFMQHMDPYFGPIGGGTTSGGFGNAFSIRPDVWYGPQRGTASLGAGGDLTITSPASTMPGPVNIKLIFPDGIEVFDPLFFSYGPFLQYPLTSGAPPQGNVPGQVAGYGLPGDNITGTFSVGGATAAAGAPGPFGLNFVGTPYPNKILSYTVPPGSPGWADLKLTTQDGTSTFPRGLFYAKSVTDYASADTFTSVLYDPVRHQLYLSAGDHIDVFSLLSNSFVAKWNPPAAGNSKQFTGLALTPDGSSLLAADLLDGSLAVLNPDNPATSYVIPITPVQTGNPGCNIGPLYVAGLINHTAAVQLGGLPSSSGGCPAYGTVYLIDLTSHAVSQLPASTISIALSATNDGSKLAFGGLCLYDAVASNSSCSGAAQTNGAAISGDGHAMAAEFVLADGNANVIGRVGRPEVYYSALGSDNAHTPLLEPKLSDSGSLYYLAFPNFIDIVDFHQGMLRIRFSLSETISNTGTPLAIDPNGRYLYLITGAGLTVIDLGEAPLSVGWLSATTASPGMQITVRGSGFNSSTTATVGGQASNVALVDANTLKLTVPSLGAGPTTIILSNSNGETYTATGFLTIL